MRALLQKVKEAKVLIEDKTISSISEGMLIFIGITAEDTPFQAKWLSEKIATLRIFDDSQGKMNLSLKETSKEVLIVSQFTLYADCTSGRRPSFTKAASADIAKPLYENFIHELRALIPKVQTGVFGAYMQVHLVNDGPMTFLLDSKSP